MNYVIYTDGGARGNPGPAATGVVITCGGQVTTLSHYLGTATNNFAEYSAVLQALRYLLNEEQERGEISFFLDSELVVKQLTGVYKIKDSNLQRLASEIMKALKEWGRQVSFTHVPREQNRQADSLVNKTLDTVLR